MREREKILIICLRRGYNQIDIDGKIANTINKENIFGLIFDVLTKRPHNYYYLYDFIKIPDQYAIGATLITLKLLSR